MGGVKGDEIEFLVEILSKYPLESLRKIASAEGLDYYRLKRIYDKYYGKYLVVSATYNIRLLGLKSFVGFLNVPADRLLEVASRMTKNPFIGYVNPAFGFKNGLSIIFYVPKEQVKDIDKMLSKYSDDFEYYEVWAYPPPEKPKKWGAWELSYDYAILMDILKWDARTPMKKIAESLGKTRPTIRYMINRLREKKILVSFFPLVDMNVHDRGVIGITSELRKEVLEKFKEHEISAGYLPGRGYLLEWFFSSKEDMGEKVLEFSAYVEKLLIEYFEPTFKELNDKNKRTAFQRMVKKDGSGYHSILEF
ncbi:Lrp/AsnC family transcriptional regulator [Thermococcus sp.]|uniref:Lrp/AsnC family transcriptional regulator n=1 Tax=Thermococcus sp. TaxID=35749 RepID=UPI0025D36D7F|nr:Lrp/AsnC family transcriptional regulator [Thermococcus sp.]